MKYSLLFVFLAAFFGKYLDFFLISYFCAIVHEIFHIIGAKLLKIDIKKIELLPFGITVKLDEKLIKDPNSEIIIASLGPISNVLMAVVAVFLKERFPFFLYHPYYAYFLKFNFSVFVLNLLPILPLDGARILRAIFSKKKGLLASQAILINTSKIFCCILLGAAIYLFLINNFNLSLILIGTFLISNLTLESRTINLAFMKEILNFDSKFSKKEINRTKLIAVSSDFYAIKTLKHFICQEYCLVSIFDNSMKIIKILTESEIIKLVSEKGVREKFSSLI